MVEYLRILRKRWLVVGFAMVVGLAISVVYLAAAQKIYIASAQIFVATSSSENTSSLAQGNTFAEARVQSYTTAATSPSVTEGVVKQLGLSMTASDLAQKISADAPLNKVLVNIHVKDQSPELSARIANAVAIQFVKDVEGLEATSVGAAASPVKLTVVHPATVPGSPSSPRPKIAVGLGLLAGLVLGLALAVMRETFDTRIRSAKDLERVAVRPVLGVIPLDKKAASSKVAFWTDSSGRRAEAFRRLRTNLQFIDVDNPPRVVAVLSGLAGEGKSTTSLNLAAALAEAGRRVCLVEGDLRRPTIAANLGIVGAVGLTSVLVGSLPLDEALQEVSENLTVLTAGPIPPNPSELLSTTHVRTVISQLADLFDIVIVDSAPVLQVADGPEVAAIADVSLLVVSADKASSDQVTASMRAVANVGAKVGGLVLNKSRSKSEPGSYEGYYGYSAADAPQLARNGG